MRLRFGWLILVFFLFVVNCGGKKMEKVEGLKIFILPVGEIPAEIINGLVKPIEERFGYPVKILEKIPEQEASYNPQRKQYFASTILKDLEKNLPKESLHLLGIIDRDLYATGYNFIFGQAGGKVCLVSIYRFKPCSWGLLKKEEENLLLSRVTKTAIHELGHTFGLEHCKDNQCVMYFSNWLGDTDTKSDNFCPKHQEEIKKILGL